MGDIFTMGVGFGIGAVTFSLVRYKIESKPTLFKIKNNGKQNIADSNSNSVGHGNSAEKNSTDKETEIQTEKTESRKLIVIGTLTDSHPETIMIGVMIALGIPGLFPMALALFIVNFAATIVGTRELIAEREPKRKILQKMNYGIHVCCHRRSNWILSNTVS